ncbi:MAG: hypothetical protein IT283_06155 [Bacteroidetes bacterium]|nr:hypothetical protein [Bacteroidota bacterium]
MIQIAEIFLKITGKNRVWIMRRRYVQQCSSVCEVKGREKAAAAGLWCMSALGSPKLRRCRNIFVFILSNRQSIISDDPGQAMQK